jgi:hypothetical protein
MGYVIVFGIIIIFSALIAWRMVVGIDYMQKNHPDYKGEDFLNWGDDKEENENDKNQIL